MAPCRPIQQIKIGILLNVDFVKPMIQSTLLRNVVILKKYDESDWIYDECKHV